MFAEKYLTKGGKMQLIGDLIEKGKYITSEQLNSKGIFEYESRRYEYLVSSDEMYEAYRSLDKSDGGMSEYREYWYENICDKKVICKIKKTKTFETDKGFIDEMLFHYSKEGRLLSEEEYNYILGTNGNPALISRDYQIYDYNDFTKKVKSYRTFSQYQKMFYHNDVSYYRLEDLSNYPNKCI